VVYESAAGVKRPQLILIHLLVLDRERLEAQFTIGEMAGDLLDEA
jgi:hypothetical protein